MVTMFSVIWGVFVYVCFLFFFPLGDQEISCNVIKCERDGIIKLISESLSSSDMKILKRPTHIKNMCAALFASNSIIKKNYIRYEKK